MKVTIIIAVSILMLSCILFAYLGGFSQSCVDIEVQGGETVVYRKVVGDYKQTGAVMDSIYYSLLNNYDIETFKGYGKYYDDPHMVEKSQLRSEAGCVVEQSDAYKLAQLPEGFLVAQIPVKRYITTSFPYKGKWSVLLSIMKVYPAMEKFARLHDMNKQGAVIELYDIPQKRILYRKEY